jgi:hypothetical protein
MYDTDKCPFCESEKMVKELAEKVDELELFTPVMP